MPKMKQFKLNIFRKIKIFVFPSHPPFTRLLTEKYCTDRQSSQSHATGQKKMAIDMPVKYSWSNNVGYLVLLTG
jgi:hypothetical protein